MNDKALAEVFYTAKNIDKDFDNSSNDEKTILTIQLTLRIAHACEQEKEFIAAVLYHNYPPIRLTQIEAEFLKTGELPHLLESAPHLFAA